MLASSGSCACCRRPALAAGTMLPSARPQVQATRQAAAARRVVWPDACKPTGSRRHMPHVSAQQTNSPRQILRQRCRVQKQAAALWQGSHVAASARSASGSSSSSSSSDIEPTDVVIVGGGLAGLAAGLALKKAGASQWLRALSRHSTNAQCCGQTGRMASSQVQVADGSGTEQDAVAWRLMSKDLSGFSQ